MYTDQRWGCWNVGQLCVRIKDEIVELWDVGCWGWDVGCGMLGFGDVGMLLVDIWMLVCGMCHIGMLWFGNRRMWGVGCRM